MKLIKYATTILISLVAILLVLNSIQFVQKKDIKEQLEECETEKQELKEENEELKSNLEECETEVERLKRAILLMAAYENDGIGDDDY